MVASRDDDLHVGALLGGIGKKLVICGLCRCRRVAVVEDVSCHEECVGLLLGDSLQEPFQKMLVLRQTVVAMEKVAQVPVAGCYDFHIYLVAMIFVLVDC